MWRNSGIWRTPGLAISLPVRTGAENFRANTQPGVKRLGLESRICEIIDHRIMLPAVGQGAIALEIREGDQEVSKLLEVLEDVRTRAEVLAERSMLKILGGGCQVPIGAFAACRENELILSAIVANLDGSLVIRGEKTGLVEEAEGVGISLARKLQMVGANDIVRALHQKTGP